MLVGSGRCGYRSLYKVVFYLTAYRGTDAALVNSRGHVVRKYVVRNPYTQVFFTAGQRRNTGPVKGAGLGTGCAGDGGGLVFARLKNAVAVPVDPDIDIAYRSGSVDTVYRHTVAARSRIGGQRSDAVFFQAVAVAAHIVGTGSHVGGRTVVTLRTDGSQKDARRTAVIVGRRLVVFKRSGNVATVKAAGAANEGLGRTHTVERADFRTGIHAVTHRSADFVTQVAVPVGTLFQVGRCVSAHFHVKRHICTIRETVGAVGQIIVGGCTARHTVVVAAPKEQALGGSNSPHGGKAGTVLVVGRDEDYVCQINTGRGFHRYPTALFRRIILAQLAVFVIAEGVNLMVGRVHRKIAYAATVARTGRGRNHERCARERCRHRNGAGLCGRRRTVADVYSLPPGVPGA